MSSRISKVRAELTGGPTLLGRHLQAVGWKILLEAFTRFHRIAAPKNPEPSVFCVTLCREHTTGSVTGRRSARWDGRTRAAIAAVMRQSEQAQALLGGGDVDVAADARDERLAQLRGLLS